MKRPAFPLHAGLVCAALAGVAAVVLGSIVAAAQSPPPLLGRVAVALLEAQIQSREVKLDYQKGGLGFLPSLLTHLGVNVDSQLLVFSKTSFRADLIGPATPRAVYFNDNVFVGFTRQGDIELAALDPAQGIVFYTLTAAPASVPRFLRRDAECASCH